MSKSYRFELATDKQKKKFGHYLNDDEEMLIFTTVSSVYLIQKFIFHFSIVFLIAAPIAYLIHRFLNVELLVAIGIALLPALIYAAQRYYFTKEGIQYILTSRRLIVQIGYFQVTLTAANYNKITHTEVEQSLLDRLFHKYGRLIVRTAGLDNKPIALDYLAYPIEFKNILESLIYKERQRYGHSGI